MSTLTHGASLESSSIHIIGVSETVRKSGRPDVDLIAEAVSFLHKDGIIVLENAVDEIHIDDLNAIMTADAMSMASDPLAHFNFGKQTRNIDQAPPFVVEKMYKDVWANSTVLSILSYVLGPQPVLHYVGGNTALQAAPSGRQPVHSDIDGPHPIYGPFSYVVNVYLTSTSPENGATELWPGSHHESTPECHVQVADSLGGNLAVREALVEKRRKHSPPIQPSLKKGSIVIRDLRLWHAGRPNLTQVPRIMLAFLFMPAWYQCPVKVTLPASVKKLVQTWEGEMLVAAEWTVDDVNHKEINSEDLTVNSGWKGLKRWEKELCYGKTSHPSTG